MCKLTCAVGGPIVLSQPHFYQGAKEYIDAITGMKPSLEHSTDIDIEPVSVIFALYCFIFVDKKFKFIGISMDFSF